MNPIDLFTYKSTSFFYDENFVRYRLVKNNLSNDKPYNLLFLPGGPGADSRYYLSLIEYLGDLGNFWLVDFPANGNNIQKNIDTDYDFNLWENYLIPAIQRFEKPILVGQSFGGMFPLLFPELEEILNGFIILNSAPRLWFSEAINYAKENNISTVSEAGIKFRENPTSETFKAALLANAHCHFPAKSIEAGKEMFEKMLFNYKAMLWWLKKARDINFDAKWIPQQVPTLIMGGDKDFVVPCSIFEMDKRFHRKNIEIKTLQDAGHFIWMDQMTTVREAFNSFISRLSI